MTFHYSDNIWRMLACHACEGSVLERINEGTICIFVRRIINLRWYGIKPCGYLSYVQDGVVR